jgi:probable rRNA maturation factor
MSLAIDIAYDSPLWSDLPYIELWSHDIIGYATQIIDVDRGRISLCLSDDRQIRILNKQWRAQDKATNVLSFPSPPSMNFEEHILGDIIIAYETVERECVDEHKTFRDHYAHLLVHGFLHLMGYDHASEDEAIEMEHIERDILALMHIEDPYKD